MKKEVAKMDSKLETLVEFDEFGFVKGYLCPHCKGKVKLDHTDDIGTKFFKCEKCGEQSTKLKSEARESLDDTLEKAAYDDEEGHFNPILFAKHLLEEFNFKTTRDNETLFIFNLDQGIYKDEGRAFVKEQMAKELDESNRARYVADVLHHIHGLTYFDRENNPAHQIAVENGILDVTTRELTPHTPELFITTYIPVGYNPKAKCPKILKFLEEVVTKDQLPVIQEIFGYCLLKAMPFHKALMLIGFGANGKSTLITLLKMLLGEENVSNATLQSLCHNRFASAQLYGKLANLCADIPKTALARTGTFKMLTGNDTITAEHKHKSLFSFRNHAKLVFSANEVPDTKDDTLAYFRRWIIISCNNIFRGPNRNPYILEEIVTPKALSGLLNFALEGLDNLLKNGGFSTSETIEELRSHYIRKSNSAKAYIEEKLEYDPEGGIIKTSTMYEQYIIFCQDNKLPAKQKREFTINMNLLLPRVHKVQRRIQKKRVWVWDSARCSSVTTVTPPLLKHNKSIKQVSQNKIDKRMEKERIKEGVVTPVTPTTCPLCLLALPKDKKKLSSWEGKIAHKNCVEDVEKGRRKGVT